MFQTSNANIGQEALDFRGLCNLIVQRMNLEVDPDTLTEDTPLMDEGLGLDSIDCLELAVALQKLHRVKITQKDTTAFRTIGSLLAFCSAQLGATA